MPYSNKDHAAIAVLLMINPRSIAEDFEYAGKIFGRPDGQFDYTWPRRGLPGQETDRGNTSIAGIGIPEGCVEVGMYHTHGAYPPAARRSALRAAMHNAPPDPTDTHIFQNRDEFGQFRPWSHGFSLTDLRTLQARAEALGDPGYSSWLATPGGQIFVWRRGMLAQERLV